MDRTGKPETVGEVASATAQEVKQAVREQHSLERYIRAAIRLHPTRKPVERSYRIASDNSGFSAARYGFATTAAEAGATFEIRSRRSRLLPASGLCSL